MPFSTRLRLPRARTLAVVLASVLGAAVASPPADAAKVTQKKAMWGPITRDGVSQFPIYKDLGVGIFQYAIDWRGAAPTRPISPKDPADPAYRWPAELDFAASEARKHGMKVMLMLIRTPSWANGGKESNWAPDNPRDFAEFAYAASKRYPSVHLWMVWGEPSRDANFRPNVDETASRRGRPLAAAQKVGPRTYARILDATYGSLKQASRRNTVIGGNTFTTGSITPLNWIRNLRLPNGRAPRLDMYGHNPISARRPDLRRAPLGRGLADFSDLDTLMGWLDRYLMPPNRKGKKLRLFLSEFVLPTDHFSNEINFYVSHKTQANWTRDALRITRRTPRLFTLGWFQLYDEAPNASNDENRYGLLDAAGRRKPAYAAFRRG